MNNKKNLKVLINKRLRKEKRSMLRYASHRKIRNIFLSNLILFILASFLKKSNFKDKNKIYSLFSKAYRTHFVLSVFCSKEINLLQKVYFF